MEGTINVLVVDDEEILRNLLDKILRREGHNVYLASSGREALDTLETEQVDVVVSDIKMPGMDGFALLKEVSNRYPDVGVVMMTAYADTCSVKDVLLLGADDYIMKPFKSVEICMIIERTYWRLLSKQDSADQPSAG